MFIKKDTPQVIKGGFFEDNRGIMRFVNDFHCEGIKRFYFIKHPDISFVRAWQGHQFEKKYFYPISGSFVIAWVKIDNFDNPSINLTPDYHILDSNKSELLYIPKGYANGLKALKKNSEVLIFSDMELEKSINKKIRYDKNLWLNWSEF